MYARDEAVIATPVGSVRVTGDGNRLTSVTIAPGLPEKNGISGSVGVAVLQLKQWFAGERDTFDLLLAPAATPRGQALREAIAGIGYGETLSYGALARQAGSGARAIGQACARNSFPIIIPCHRVLGAQGVLGAYSAGEGPITKQWLLDHERRHANRQAA